MRTSPDPSGFQFAAMMQKRCISLRQDRARDLYLAQRRVLRADGRRLTRFGRGPPAFLLSLDANRCARSSRPRGYDSAVSVGGRQTAILAFRHRKATFARSVSATGRPQTPATYAFRNPPGLADGMSFVAQHLSCGRCQSRRQPASQAESARRIRSPLGCPAEYPDFSRTEPVSSRDSITVAGGAGK